MSITWQSRANASAELDLRYAVEAVAWRLAFLFEPRGVHNRRLQIVAAPAPLGKKPLGKNM